jgi:PKD repeat protein
MRVTGFSLLILILVTGCYKNEPVPTAAFSYQGNNSFRVPCNIIFSSESQNAFSYEWDFGDDSTSADVNPSHTYFTPGTYYVRLRSFTESRKIWASAEQAITIADTVEGK